LAPNPPREQAIAAFAARQHAVIDLDQLRGLGLSASAVRTRVAAGRLHPKYPGVFAVGHPLLSLNGRQMAAVLACGPGAALSHRSAAAHHNVLASARRAIDVTSPTRRGRKLDGIDAHSGATLLPHDIEIVDAIPTTSLARTLLDIAETVTTRQLERAIEQAAILRILDVNPIDDVLNRASGRRGATTLRALLSAMQSGSTPTPTRNDLEERFLHICRAIGHPPDGVNVWLLDRYEADFLWRAPRLVAETDGRATHLTPQAFEHDRHRDQQLAVAGWRVVRFSQRQVYETPAAVAATLTALLAQTAQRP
jgi:predicted transcriptional regulator of viral defense system